MPREKELFRDNLARIDAAFPEKEMIRIGEAKKFIGVRNHYTALKILGMKKGEEFISKCQLASRLS